MQPRAYLNTKFPIQYLRAPIRHDTVHGERYYRNRWQWTVSVDTD